MRVFGLYQTIMLLLGAALIAVGVYLLWLIIKALRKYTRSAPVRKKKAENARTLGEVLKQHRVGCKMTQEFVAESLGVSRQAVSKWERGLPTPARPILWRWQDCSAPRTKSC